ncbi:MAG: recombination protein O N-terminal domain-containing protein [Ghiorsea sp.]
MAEQRNHALLLRSIPYSDTSLILHLLTEDFGRIALMARGARRAKSPFRAGLMPQHQLHIRWREPRTGSMGTLVEVQRLAPLLPESKVLAGQELFATASALFPDGVSHGYIELLHACKMLAERPDESGVCAATWSMLETSGWTGDLGHCWHCVEAIDLNLGMYWRQGHLLCSTCANQHGYKLSSGFRKSIAGHMNNTAIKLSRDHITLWEMMIKDVFKTHQIYQK